ncbi:MAG: fibronectin type III domain-containing protein, partial [Methanomassiliicoccales archaeon]
MMEGNLNTVSSVEGSVSGTDTFDLSTEPYFPQIGSQGGQGSCAGWALSYYAYGYMEAKDKGWTEASSGNPEQLISPAWTYNLANGGYDGGSSIYRNGMILEEWGAPTLSTMPYDPDDAVSWGDEESWREAPLHRARDVHTMSYSGESTVEDVKELVSSGTPVVFGFNANEYSSGFSDGNYILSSEEYSASTINHAQTVVGWDDSVSDDGETGAFRVANSWGTDFAEDGYYWLTYDAFMEIGDLLSLTYMSDRSDYQPELLGTWEFGESPTRDAVIELGMGGHSSPMETRKPEYVANRDGHNPTFPSFMCADITEFSDKLEGDTDFYLEIGSATSGGTITSFKVERYNDYGGQPAEVSEQSPDVPVSTPGYATCTLGEEETSVPTAPQNLAADADDGKVSLTWNAPSDDGGASITDYRIYRGTSSGQLSHHTTTGSTSYTDSSVTNGQKYYYKVSAVNSEGEGPKSSEVSATPESADQDTEPSAPQDLTASSSDGKVSLSWNAPSDDGGASITDYRIYRGTSSGQLSHHTTTGSTSYTDSSVTNGQKYYYKVSAVNSEGEGPKSSEVSATPESSDEKTVPSAPQNLKVTPGDGSASVSWDPPADDGESDIDYYKVYRRTPDQSYFFVYKTETTNFNQDGLKNGQTYLYSVKAVNSEGQGPKTSEVEVVPGSDASTVPSEPRNLAADADDGKVSLTWNAPSDDGGASITDYRIYRGTSSGQLSHHTTTGSTSYTDSSVTNGQKYYYKVSAVNSEG